MRQRPNEIPQANAWGICVGLFGFLNARESSQANPNHTASTNGRFGISSWELMELDTSIPFQVDSQV